MVKLLPFGEFERRNVYEVKKIAGVCCCGCAGGYDYGCDEFYGECGYRKYYCSRKWSSGNY